MLNKLLYFYKNSRCLRWRTVKNGKAASRAKHDAADPLVAFTNKLYENKLFGATLECDIFEQSKVY